MDLVQAKPQTIVFNNQILTTFEKDGVRYVAIKPICENMGIEWSTQLQKLNRNKEKFGCVHMNIPSKGGNQSTLQSRILGFALKSISCCHDGNNWKGSQLPV